MTLDKAKRGQHVKIISIPNENIRAQAIRFGIAEGEVVLCEEVLPAGPIVLRKNRQEIAIGRGLANRITIALN
ncbi:FeoA family protein [Desulfallas thermosapovorans]|uniref:Fe2+ transport system protein FeoA n=1 Tax=Desulfallas thermosapovorans DSM 6562 TaxID=1121431 RepID=A0A5S4ZYE6_9FIRM|nr:ferrous iron transport protein A [Desulfallas thermosapovorans]TYO98042.1 Fe2+ transport system protein FeoA [Desulfallas thermosapovorans DSM 6562]